MYIYTKTLQNILINTKSVSLFSQANLVNSMKRE